MPPPPPKKLFVSYSHKDNDLRQQLEEHLALLQRQGHVDTWSDHCIEPGETWAEEIDDNLESAELVLLLASPSFLASPYCYETEMDRALERHANGEARVIPVIVRPCDWETSRFAQLQVLPKDAKPVTTWDHRDAAWLDVVKGLRRVVNAEAEPEDEPGAVKQAPRFFHWPRFVVALLVLLAIAATMILQREDTPPEPYRLRVTVLALDGMPSDAAEVRSSVGGELKQVEGGWEIEIPAGNVPSDGNIEIWAENADAFLKGSATVQVGEERNLNQTVQLHKEEGEVRGTVTNRAGEPLAGARVIVQGWGDKVFVTGEDGVFVLPAHAAVGQRVRIEVEFAGYKRKVQRESVGGSPAVLVLWEE